MSPAAHEVFIRRAVQIAEENILKVDGGPFGCVIVKDGKIVAEGVNAVTRNNDPTAHAEVAAIRKACEVLKTFQLNDCDVYTSCEPCPMCLGALYWARPRAVYYSATRIDAAQAGFDDDLIYQEISTLPSKRSLPFEQVLPTAAYKLFSDWKLKVGKIRY